MTHKMPIGGYKWMSSDEIENIDFATIDITGDYGFILEADLEVLFILLYYKDNVL